MGKSILVIDTPESCTECTFSEYQGIVCRATGLNKSHSNPEKPDWCPLQDAPNKKGKNPYHNERESGYVDGWNDCLDQILNGG